MADDDRRGRWQGFDLGGGNRDPRSRWRFSVGYVLIGLLVLYFVQSLFVTGATELRYDEFKQAVERDRIVGVVRISETQISGTLVQRDGSRVQFRATRPPDLQDDELIPLLEQNNVQYTGEQPSAITSFLLSWILPILILVLIWSFVFRRMAGGGAAGALNLGRRGVKIYDRKDLKTTFNDVAGVDEAVEELGEIVEFLKNPKKYQRLGGRIPKGVLLLGPPGCGKTLLARAVAGEAGVPFFYMSGSEFVEMFVGLGAARVRELFQQAKDKAPCLVFLDELDTIGKTRAGALGAGMGSHDEREQTLNQLLVEMDGFDTSKGVIIMAATNRPDVLDPALLRPGRFDRQVVVDRPDLKGREAILKVHARDVKMAADVELQVIAARTPGFTGADLANVVNEAALLAARREKDAVTMAELDEAIDRVIAGLERKSRVISEKEREIVAFHEMGHALVALSVKNSDPVHRVSIIPRGAAALGMTIQRPLEDRYIVTEPQLQDRLTVLLGGRTAEELVFRQMSTGAQDDLQRATEIARAMVTEYGMSPRLGPLSFGRDGFRSPEGRMLFPGERPEMSEETAKMVDQEVTRIVGEAHQRAQDILESQRDLLDGLARLLMVQEVLEGKELDRYVKDGEPVPDPEVVAAALRRGAEADEGVSEEKKTRVGTAPRARTARPASPREDRPTEKLPAPDRPTEEVPRRP
ncbi:MAG TPA: ATP-dependent zinc metalloprotease FtsH [Actinomycetota bacterium]|jgi:cell division protease FtsH|nr:ATP-dependent zinc metalloprotease FtsH [Actinomycetota bacterium]